MIKIKLVDIENKHLEKLQEIFERAGYSLAEGKYPAATAFYITLAGVIGSELASRRFAKARTNGGIEIDPAILETLKPFERVLICDHLTELSEDLPNQAVRDVLDKMLFSWFRDVETV